MFILRREAISRSAQLIAVVVILIVAAGSLYYYYQSSTASHSPVTLTIYGSVDTTDMQTVIKDFQGNYSWITVNYVEMFPPQALTKVSSEMAANQSTADMIFETNSVVDVMKTKGFLQSYNSTQLSNYPSSYYDPGGYWATAILLPVVFSYNTQALQPSQLPTLAGLNNASWAGKMVMLDPTLGSTNTQYMLSMVPLLGNQTWTSWAQGIAQNVKPSTTSSTTGLVNSVASGQYDIGFFSYLHDIINLQHGGGNVNWFLPKLQNGSSLPLYTALESVAIVKGTPHLQAAKDFENFVLSKNGQEIIGNSAVRIPAMPGTNTPYSIEKLVPNAKVILFPTPSVSNEASQWGTIFKQWGY